MGSKIVAGKTDHLLAGTSISSLSPCLPTFFVPLNYKSDDDLLEKWSMNQLFPEQRQLVLLFAHHLLRGSTSDCESDIILYVDFELLRIFPLLPTQSHSFYRRITWKKWIWTSGTHCGRMVYIYFDTPSFLMETRDGEPVIPKKPPLLPLKNMPKHAQ